MKTIFAFSLSVIGVAIGFIIGMTATFTFNNNSFMMLLGVGGLLAIVGGVTLPKVAPFIDAHDIGTQKILVTLCAIIAIILLFFLIVTLVMLKGLYWR